MRSKKAVIFILIGIAIAAVPFFLRMRERQRTGQYINQFEEEENEESEETGNCVLAGHNGSRRGMFFTNLGSAKAGMEVKITTKAGVTHCYTVEEMRVVNPYDGWVTEESDTELLTLFTCAEHGSFVNVFRLRITAVKGGCPERMTVTGQQR